MKVKMRFITFIMACALLLLQTAHAGALKIDYPLDKITDNVYVIHGPRELPNPENEGFMNNPGLIITTAGVVVVDPGSSKQIGTMVLDKIKSVTDKPVVAVFNTHVHGDHWLGNQAIRDAYPGVKIYGHPRMLERIEAGDGESWITLMENMTKGATKGTMAVGPNNAIEDGMSVTIGDSNFSIVHLGKAHTDTDIMIHAVNESVLFLGDNVGNQRILRVDQGSFRGNIETIDAAMDLNARYHVPGHGQSGGVEVSQGYRDYLDTLYNGVKKHYDEGLSDFEIKPLLLQDMRPWEGWSGFEDEFGKHISLCYLEIEAEDF